ncbi:MAG: hypothetical protein PHT80_10065 [Lentisphaeria bacterium]|nr:hypothetical protein [Lentisphaeria bacterium]
MVLKDMKDWGLFFVAMTMKYWAKVKGEMPCLTRFPAARHFLGAQTTQYNGVNGLLPERVIGHPLRIELQAEPNVPVSLAAKRQKR